MTTPVQHGHPDWARTVSASDILVLATQTIAQAANPLLHGRFFVGNLPYLWCRVFSTAGGVRLRLVWYTAETGGFAIAENLVDALSIGVAEGSFAVLGPFVEVTTIVDATPRDINVLMWQSLSPSQTDTQTAGTALITQFQFPVPGFTAVVFDAVLIRWGWGYWNVVFDNPASFGVELRALDYTGAANNLSYIHSTMKYPGGLIVLPPQRLQVFALNNAAPAAVITVSLYVHPGPV
jgi:hypothetical protein